MIFFKKGRFCIVTVVVFSLCLVIYGYDKKMKILMVVPAFPKVHDVCMLNQIIGLTQRGHDVWILANKAGDTSVLQEDVVRYNLLAKTIIGDFPDNLNDYDIVVFQLGHRAKNIKKTHNFTGKLIICLRGYDITGFIKANPHAYNDFFEDCDLFMPVCKFFRERLLALGCPADKIVVHHSAIDCSRFVPSKNTLQKNKAITIVSAGRFVEKKGFEYSIKATAQLIKKYPQVRYVIIGDGVLKNKYKRLIKKLGVADRITLDTWHSHDEYIAILDKAHIFVLSSVTAQNDDREGVPNVLKEAMAMGLVVIATDHSGNSELIDDGVSGLLVPERDCTALYRAIDKAIVTYNVLDTMRANAHKKVVQEFERERENDTLETIFLSLLDTSL